LNSLVFRRRFGEKTGQRKIMEYNKMLLARIYRSAHQKRALMQKLLADGFRMKTHGKSR
jgi:hypothetical protein